jgi:hypothetical protein
MKNEKEVENLKNEIYLITIKELQDSLRKMENRRATGPDAINTELLKYGAEDLNNRLSNFINFCGDVLKFQKLGIKSMLFLYLKKRKTK